MININNKNIRILKENGKVVILNIHNNNWVRMKEEFYERNINREFNNNDLVKALNKYSILEDKVDNKVKNSCFKTVYFAVTNKCNLNCEFCSMKSNPSESRENDLNLEEIKNIIIPKLEEINPKRIVLTGGEPIVREDIIELIDIFSDKFGKRKIILQSNGLLVNENLVKQIGYKISKIDISIEKMFKNKNVFNNMIKNIELLRKNNVKVGFSFVIDNENKVYLKDAIDLVVKYDADFCMRLISPLGYALENNLGYLKEEEILLLYKEIVEHIIKNGYTSRGLGKLIAGDMSPKKTCGGYGNVLSIYPNGDAFICPNLGTDNFKLGNIKTSTVEEIKNSLRKVLEKSDVKELFWVDNMYICKDCSIKYFCTGFCAGTKYNCNDIKRVSQECGIKKILTTFILFYKDDKEDIIYNFKGFLKNLTKYINKKEDKIQIIN